MTGWRSALNQYKAASRRGKRENDRGTNEPLSAVSRDTHTRRETERERRVTFFFFLFFFSLSAVRAFQASSTAAPGTRRGSLASHPLTFVMLPEKGSRGMPTARTLPTLTDLGPRLRPIHEIILVHHLRALLVSRGCAPWITLTAVCWPYYCCYCCCCCCCCCESRIHFRDRKIFESLCQLLQDVSKGNWCSSSGNFVTRAFVFEKVEFENLWT